MKTMQPIRLVTAVLAGACLIAAPAGASYTNVNANADDLALYCSWEPDYAKAPGTFTFTASATCDGKTPDPTHEVNIEATGAASGNASGVNQATLTLSSVPPGAIYVTFSGANEYCRAIVHSVKVDIVQEREDYCIHGGSDTLDLTEENDSYLGLGTAYWYWSGDQVGSGRSYAFTPSEIDPCSVTVRAEAEKLPSCDDTCEVNIVEVDVDAEGCVCVTNGTAGAASRKQIAIDKCNPAAWDGHVQLFWAGGGGVKVYTDASNGVEVTSGTTFANTALPTNLWVEGTSASTVIDDVYFRLNPVLSAHPCPKAEEEGCDWGTMTAVDAWLVLPEVVGVNDLVPNYEDPAGFDKGFVATAAEYGNEDDLLLPEDWGVAPRDDSLGDISVAGDRRIRVLALIDGTLVEDPSFSPTDTAAEFKVEGIEYSAVSNDAEVVLTYSVCTVTAQTTVVQVELDKFCYNRADPFPEVEILSVIGLVTGGTATVTYKVLDDMLDSDLPEMTNNERVSRASAR